MKMIFDRKNRLFKKLVSLTLVMALVFTGMPMNYVSEEIKERIGLVLNAKADETLDELKAKYTGNAHNFTSGTPNLSEYSQCFQDSTWAASHSNDTITLNPAAGSFVFDSNYHPIGNASAAFEGTIVLNTSADDFVVDASAPIFDYVKDSVTFRRMDDSARIPLNINRANNVGDTVSPLFANHVVGSGASSPYEWKVTLNSASVRSYSGVIYEMTDGAKIELTFTDNSVHTPQLDNNNNITSGSIIDNKESGKNYGILCGDVKDGSVLQARYIKTNDDNVTFIGTETAYCGGFVGELNNSTFEILSGSSSLKVDFKTAKDQVGFICGHAENSTITLPATYTFSGTIDGNVYAGGIAGYCKNTVVDYETSTGTIALSDCVIKNGTSTGGVFGYYECDSYANDILIDRKYSLTECTIEGTVLNGGIAGEYKVTYSNAVTIDLDNYSLSTISLDTGSSAGGLFGKYTCGGNVTITDSDTTNDDFTPPSSSLVFGGIIGEFVNNSYSRTLTLTGFTVDGLSCSSSGNVGGIIRMLTGSTYVSVDGVSITNADASDAEVFGGIISTLNNSNNEGSFIDVVGDLTLSLESGKTYKGGAIAGSFKKGVIRLAGVTDISDAKAANGYAQLVYENDETLVYAKGSGEDSDWTLIRNSDTTASDLGQWGEVVRMFTVNGVEKNAEEAGIVSVANNKVTVAQGVIALTDTFSFAKCALNMQLNDGNDHGALCFADKTTYNKNILLNSAITVSGKIDLSGTGLLGLMRDGGNGKYLGDNNSFSSVVKFFTGSVTGSGSAEIILATGETYGTYEGNSTGTGGKIYVSNGYGHDAQGLFAFAKGAEVTNLKVSGSIDVERNAGSKHLYAGALFGAMTNGADISGVDITTTINATRLNDALFYIGGVVGVFDGTDTTNSNGYSLTIDTNSTIKPTINLYGSIACESGYDTKSTYVGGVLGLLKGATSTKYAVSIANSEVSPNITIDNSVSDADLSYIGGMIGRVAKNESNERSITLDTVTMSNASVDTKAKHAGGLLGAMWQRTNLTVDGLTITGSTVNHKYSKTGSQQSGLVFMGSGKWDINSLTIQATTDATPVNTSFYSTDTAPESFGLIVNQAYDGNDGLYINLLNSGYTLSGVTVPVSSSNANYFFDEIAADTKNNSCDGGDILIGGNGTGIVNINMNAANGTKTKITDVYGNTENGTGTYQNKLYSQLVNLVGNQNSRYYYNLDVMMSSGHTKTDGEKFLLWSVNQYAASNINSNFTGAVANITDIDLSGLSYYPIPGGEVTIPTSSTVTFGFKAINDYEDASRTPDDWSRNPDDNGNAKTTNARNQHYLMQTGLFTTVTSLSAANLTLTGDFGYVSGAASGALINKSTSGSVTLSGLTLDNLKPSNNDSYMLINSIDGTGTATPSLTLSNLRATNYSTGLPAAKSLFGTATGQNLTMSFSDIKLDARDDTTISDTNWTSAAASAMDTTYGTSRSIFSTAIFFTELWASKSSTIEYYYTVDEDWGSGNPRNVTYGKEVSDSREYNNGDGEKKYNIVGSGTRHFTNPISDSNTEFNFSAGFLPYVANYTSKGTNATYPVTEIKVNYKVEGLTEGCGTYNDPYVISTGAQLKLVANAVNDVDYPGSIKLPNTMTESSSLPFAATWHSGQNGDGLYNKSGSNYVADESNIGGLSTWTTAYVRNYLASAYYVINADLTGANSLPSDFDGIGKPGNTVNGNVVFHGVIVGKKSNGSAPTITNPSGNPLIYISNGSVIKNINISVTNSFTKTLGRYGDNALYGYKTNDSTYKGAEYYGGVIGEIMGGDNIIDDVTVTYSNSTITLDGSAKHLIAEGGMVGCVVNGALIFRGSNSVTGRTVTGGGIYSNPYVGRVINGYAVYEQIENKTGTAPDNGGNYHIDTIVRDNTKLDVNYSDGTITVPNAQSLYILSLITQSIASTANTSSPYDYYKYSPSYGYNKDSGYQYINGVARLGDYSSVGCGTSAAQPDDYISYASLDSVNNYTNSSSIDGLMKAPIPYIIYRYTTRYGTTTTNPAADFPARRMTFDNSKFWDITLSSSNTFNTFGDNFKAFRGIGCVGINAYSQKNAASKTAFKVATFDGGNNTIKLHISLPRYRRDQENYFHNQNKSLTQTYSGDNLDNTNYGHDGNLWQVMGIGLFDCVLVKNDSDHEYQFQNFKLQGIIEDVVYDSTGKIVTGTCTYNNKNEEQQGKTQLFCVGGVVGKRVTFGGSGDTNNAYDTDCNYSTIRFDGLTITGAYACGGLIGIDATKSGRKMEINDCNSTQNGISITGGYYGKDNNLRHGIGSFVGMTFWCRPYIDGGTNKSDISVSNVTTFYNGTGNRCAVGGLIGYTGSGAEIKNINLKGLGTNPVVGSENATNAAGYIGFSQTMNNVWTDNDYVIIENCTLNKISVKAKNSAAGFLARCGNSMTDYYPKYIRISNCAVIGDSQNKPEIKTYATASDDRFGAAGFVAEVSFNTNTPSDFNSSNTSVIENSYITDYTVEGRNTGGIIGAVSNKPIFLKNLYVKDCDIITNSSNAGGMVGLSKAKIAGYNLKIENVDFKKNTSGIISDYTSNAGIIIGANSSNLIDKFIGIGVYHTTDAKVPTTVVKTNGTNPGNFFVFADYLNTSATDLANGTGYASTFGVTAANTVADTDNNIPYPSAPYVSTSPHMTLGTDEFITGDGVGIGATVGNAGAIYKDAKADSSNRRYTIGTDTDSSFDSTEKTDSAVLATYINDDGSYKNGSFKISTASAEFGSTFTELTGVQNFAMLVINDDADKSADITPFIKSYIRLVTNAANSKNQYAVDRDAYSCGSTNTIDKLYKVVINPCYYDSGSGKFVLGTAGTQGLQIYPGTDTTNHGKYWFDSTKADSESGNTCQFSLIDVQFKDPTDTSKVAYHLYVPVYTKKMLTAEFSAVTMSATSYYRSPYASKIASEIADGKNATGNNSILVESTNEWTTTFIRYTYPKNQISSGDNWNFNKSITLYLDGNFQTLPNGTKLILLDPNANADKFYTMTLDGSYSTGTYITLNLSSFEDGSGNQFAPQNLSAILADPGASSTVTGHTNELYEDYYISMYVPKVVGQTHSVQFGSKNINIMTQTDGEEEHKANIDPKLYSLVILGDLFNHTITQNSFIVTSGDGVTFDDNREMTSVNKVLKTEVTSTVQIKDKSAGSYLSNSDVYHAFYLTLTSHDADHKVSDIIYGITPGYVQNTTTVSYTDKYGSYTDSTTHSYLGANYIYLNSGSIKDALLSTQNDESATTVVTLHSVTTMTFNDITAFPFNQSGAAGIGTQVSVKSNLAYREEDLRFSALNAREEDPEGKFYYSTSKNSAQLSFNAVPADDVTDEIGLKTNNRSLLGVNGKYGVQHPVYGKAIYNVDDIIDYNSAENVVYTISLFKKVTDGNGTHYDQVDNISDYLSNVTLTDSNSEVTLIADTTTDPQTYVYTGAIDHNSQVDLDKMFEVDFSCIVHSGDAAHNEYANYKVLLTADLDGATNAWKEAYLIYTNAKFDPSVIDE